MPGATFLRGDRVALRTIEDEDIELLQRARNDPALRRGLLFRYPQNRANVETFIEETIADDDNDRLSLLICVDGEPVGSVSLFNILPPASGTLAYWLLPDYRGDGYATESAGLVVDYAFQTLGLHRVLAWTIDYNEASQSLLHRLGFSHEGTYREHVFRNGDFHDTEHYGLLVSEWSGYDKID
ncbi:GNAT family N-acetyltransferase [Halocatena marina]|uniref:GNAT family N-acetyltransferase n=1 Tax=Halocatena marina TaxID=2934937 RepID=A0ABD5YPM9_9EURY|nr:GNAT family protein [Halocatena marina]